MNMKHKYREKMGIQQGKYEIKMKQKSKIG